MIQDVIRTIRKNRNFIYLAAGLFLTFFVLGLVAPDIMQSPLDDLLDSILAQMSDMGFFETFLFILWTNSKAAFIGVLSGFLLGIIPFIATIVNGYIVGAVMNRAIERKGFLVLWKIIPHGIFEMPAVMISFGLGISIGFRVLQQRPKETLKDYREAFRVLGILILPLLLVAALIEASLVFIA